MCEKRVKLPESQPVIITTFFPLFIFTFELLKSFSIIKNKPFNKKKNNETIPRTIEPKKLAIFFKKKKIRLVGKELCFYVCC